MEKLWIYIYNDNFNRILLSFFLHPKYIAPLHVFCYSPSLLTEPYNTFITDRLFVFIMDRLSAPVKYTNFNVVFI